MRKRPTGKLVTRINKKVLSKRIHFMSRQIAHDFGNQPVVLMPIMTGGLMLSADIVRHIGETESAAKEIIILPLDAGSYGSEHVSKEVRLALPKWDMARLRGEDVLLVDDILDTGKTLRAVHEFVAAAQPKSISLVVLLEKAVKREPLPQLRAYHYGFRIPDCWVVGYGLDQDGYFRGLPNTSEYVERGRSRAKNFRAEPGGPM